MSRNHLVVPGAVVAVSVVAWLLVGRAGGEPAAEPIVPSGVAASSTETGVKDVRHVIDGSGLEESPKGSGKFVHTDNAYADGGSMWCSAHGDKDKQPTVTFTFDRPVTIGSIRIWNYNEAKGYSSRSVKGLGVESSEDGTTFAAQGQTLLKKAPGTPGYAGEVISFKQPIKAKAVRLKLLSNHGGEIFGLSEVRFYAGGAGAAGAIDQSTRLPVEKKTGQREHPKPNPSRHATAGEENIVFPADSGIIDVTAAPYNAKGDGKTDDTAAIQKALDDWPAAHAILYLPNGTYVISDTLRWTRGPRGGMEEKHQILQGQSAAGVVLKLPDRAPGYTDPAKPKAMCWTGDAPAQRFGNAVRNVTFDVGSGNPGAIALRFHANNQGCVRDVVIRSTDGQGAIGLDMSYTNEIGPLLVKNLKVVGFDVGIACRNGINTQTLEHILLEGQKVVGLRSEGQILSIRGLRSSNAVPAIRSSDPSAMLTLIDSVLKGTGQAASRPAIVLEKKSTAYIRNLATSGYGRAIEAPNAPESPTVQEWVTHSPITLFPGGRTTSLNLPIRETPEVPWDDLSEWISPLAFGGQPDDGGDDTEAIQKAIDSGKTTVYLPHGSWKVSDTIKIRGNVRRLIGCEASIDLPQMKKPAFVVEEGKPPVVQVERLSNGYTQTTFIDNASSRTLVLATCLNVNGVFTGTGDVFIEDVCANPFTQFSFKGQHVWARQLNVENKGTHILNDGGTLWVLGYKTERGGTLAATENGGKTEILGGMSYTTGDGKLAPMFTVKNASLSAVFGETFFNFKDSPFTVLVEEVRDGQTNQLKKGDAPGRLNGSMLPLFVGSPK